MATIITVPGAGFAANRRGFMPPVRDGLEGWFNVSESADLARRNLAPGKSDGAIVGSPVYAASHVTLGAGAYIETGIEQVGDCHLLAVLRMPEGTVFGANFGVGVSSYLTGASGPLLCYKAGSGSAPFPAAQPYVSAAFTVSGSPSFVQGLATNTPDARNWSCLTGRFLGGTGLRVRNKTVGTTGSTANANPVHDQPNTFRIGANSTTSGLATDVAFAAIYSRALSDTEETAVYAAVQAYLSRRFSITV